ncbi:MAG: VWA domain-containing protein [Firmicutes bacterium]|nr:VWA domain-containing protein [Bacillota bacterium]
MILRDPLFLLLLIPFAFLVYLNRRFNQPGAICYSDTSVCAGIDSGWKTVGMKYLPWLNVAALTLVIIALARPQMGLKEYQVRKEGIDIILTLDASGSMTTQDFVIAGTRTSRFEAVKKVARNFIAKRPNDRIGIVIFAGRPYILSPLTWDHSWTESRLEESQAGTIDNSTAIGSALATSLNRLRESKAKSKVIVLLTDGENNAGSIMPEAAAQAAKTLKIKVYTIGAGSERYAQLDEGLLQKIADITGGRYFRATDSQSLTTIFRQIDKLEKSVIEMPHYREYLDLYPCFLLGALLLFLAEAILANTVLRRLP